MPDELRPYLMCHSYPSIFSSCLLPHEIAGLAATLEVIRASDAARATLRRHTERLRRSFTELGYPIQHGSEQILSLEAGPEMDTLALRDRLEDHGVFGAVFCAPATSRNRSMVRLTLNAGLTEAELRHVEEAARGPRSITRVVLDPGHGGHDPGASGPSGLREKDVTLDIAHRAAPLIARELGITESTVKVHLRNIMSKLHATNRTQVAYMLANGSIATPHKLEPITMTGSVSELFPAVVDATSSKTSTTTRLES